MEPPECFAFVLENMHPESDVAPAQQAHVQELKMHCLVKQWTLEIAAYRMRAA